MLAVKKHTLSDDPRHAAQHRALQKFAQTAASRLALMKYRPWTTPGTLAAARIGPSHRLPGFVGVFALKATKAGAFCCAYPGLLVWKELHEEFDRSWHCPTAIEMPTLDYAVDAATASAMGLGSDSRRSDGWSTVHMVLIGDPRHAGPLVNSPRGIVVDGKQVKPNAMLQTVARHQQTSLIRRDGDKLVVEGDIVCVNSKGHVSSDEELLLLYDGSDIDKTSVKTSTYWLQHDDIDSVFCYACCGKESDDRGNALFVCSSGRCFRALHRDCFPLHDGSYRQAEWFCTKHTVGTRNRITATPVKSAASTVRAAPATFAASGAAPVVRGLAHCLSAPAWVPGRCRIAATPPKTVRNSVALNINQAQLKSSFADRIAAAGSLHDARSKLCAPQPITAASIAAARLDEADPCGIFDISSSSSDADSSSSESEGESPEPIASDVVEINDTDTVMTTSTSRPSLGRALSFPRRPVQVQFAITDVGFEQVRAVWKQFGPKILLKTPRATWHLRYDDAQDDTDSTREKKSRQQLQLDWNTVQLCCGKRLALRFCQDPAALLRARLAQMEMVGFDKSKSKNAVATAFGNSSKLAYLHAEVCDTCFSACLGVSTRTLRRTLSHDLAPSKRRGIHSRVPALANQLLAFAEEVGQHDPEGVLGKSYDSAFVVPYITQSLAMAALQDWIRQRDNLDRVVVSRSAFQRAVQHLLEASPSVYIHMKKQKKLAGCATCEKLQNDVNRFGKARDQAAQSTAKRQLKEHNDEARQQRDFFKQQKDTSLAQPWDMMTITSDGMDSAKTHLPHMQRLSKAPDVEAQINVRVVGMVGYGTPRTCAAITAFDDVNCKGGAASVTHLEQLLNLMWTTMDVTNVTPIPAARGFVEKQEDAVPILSAQDARDLSVQFRNSLTDASFQQPDAVDPFAAETKPFVPAQPFPRRFRAQTTPIMEEAAEGAHDAYVKAADEAVTNKTTARLPFLWPKSLHFTFDNTASDNKNRTVFNFVGMLVGIGLFAWVTLSMLLVGHTHDIVDQMFSVWARQLGVENAPTLTALHSMFRTCYGSKILDLKQTADQAAAGDRIASKTLAAHLASVADLLGVEVAIVRQMVCVEPFPLLEQQIGGISSAHVFLMRVEQCPARAASKGKSGVSDPVTAHAAGPAVVMYSRHLAQESNDPQLNRHELYTNVPLGPWTSKKTLFFVDEIPTDDPILKPVQPVPLAGIRACINSHKKQGNMTEKEVEEWRRLLESFENSVAAQKRACNDCARLQQQISDIGVIHRATSSSTPAEKETTKTQEKAKRDLRQALASHIQNVQHATHKGWWKKWIERVELFVKPYYRARRLLNELSAEQRASSGFRPHPRYLPSDPDGPMVLKTRNDVERREAYGNPTVGQFVVVRSGDVLEPFYVGEIVIDEHGDDKNTKAQRAEAAGEKRKSCGVSATEQKESAKKGKLTLQSSKSKPKGATQPSPEVSSSDDDDDDDDDERGAQASQKARVVDKHKGPGGASKIAHARAERASQARDGQQITVRWMSTKDKRSVDPNNRARALLSQKEKALWDSAVAAKGTNEFVRMPRAAITRYVDAVFVFPSSKKIDLKHNFSTNAVETCIWWGRKNEVLTKPGTLTIEVYKTIMEDLHETSDHRHMDAEEATAAAIAAAAAALAAAGAAGAAREGAAAGAAAAVGTSSGVVAMDSSQ